MNHTFAAALTLLLLLPSSFATERVPWATSRVQGSPERPAAYRIQRIFPALSFTNPVDIAFSRELGRWFVAEQGGKLHTFDTEGKTRHLAADFGPLQGREGNLYAFTFDPNFASNHFVYVCYVLKSDLPDGSRVSRFKLKQTAEPEIDLSSEELLVTWFSGGHNGCCLKFGLDGYLYISTGDGAGPNPPDPTKTGQDISDLLSSLLRIDVHRRDPGKPYGIPKDNPFIGRENTRPEVWAFGFRNPWRFGIDQKNGEIWVADVGWELWELIYRVERGGNYGWSIVEGRQPVHTTGTRGPGPIIPPIKDHPHSEAASITGGLVYYGKKFPSLTGAYIYGDWETGKIWGLRADKEKPVWSEELVDTSIRVVAFADDKSGEIVILDYNGGIYSLEVNSSTDSQQKFPTRLSETGLFTSVSMHEVAPGVVPFEVNATMWTDHAAAQRWLALPNDTKINVTEKPWRYPSNAVLLRTISMEMERGRPASRKRLETQLLHFNGDTWSAYSYRWNDEQTDAALVPAEGAETTLQVKDTSEPGGLRLQSWRFHARAECLRCHNPWCGTALGFQPDQLKPEALKDFEGQSFFAASLKERPKPLVSPYDAGQDLSLRARSYLHANCSHCHRDNAGGSVPAVMNFDLPLEKMHMVNARPTRGDLGLNEGRLIAPAMPFRSVILFRNSSTGRSRMPYIGSKIVDEEGISLLREWIESLPADTASNAKNSGTLAEIRAKLAKPETDLEQFVAQNTLNTSAALLFAHAVAHPSLSVDRKEQVGRAAMKNTNPLVRELFERFLPAEARTANPQMTAPREEILALKGDAKRGVALLSDSARMSCLQCHRYQNAGRDFGPEFKKAAGKKTRSELLQNILEPSGQIAPEYVLYTADLNDDEQLLGIIVKKTKDEVILRDTAAVDHPIAAGQIKSLRAQQLSAMPEGLLAGLSAQEVADLLEALMAEAAQ